LEAARDLHEGRYLDAEVQAKEAANTFFAGDSRNVLGQALEAQGKYAEALAAYTRSVRDSAGKDSGGNAQAQLQYRQMLLVADRWTEALAAYDRALNTGSAENGEDLDPTVSRFNVLNPEPTALAAAIHIARGRLDNEYHDCANEPLDKEALDQYAVALKLEPNSGLANYYFALGLQRLGRTTEATEAFKRTISLADDRIKGLAERQLAGLQSPPGAN
jgi:tetratricopeptide (TPR) repeat protein